MPNLDNCQQNFTWHNWNGNLTATPSNYCKPTDANDLPKIVLAAKNAGKKVRVLGGGFSWTPVVPTNDYMIDMTNFNRIISVDMEKNLVTVEAGMMVGDLSVELSEKYKLSLETETVIPYVTVGGAVALGCHGTGYNQGTYSDLVVGMEVILADGTWQTFTVESDGEEMMNALRVSLGALGIIFSVTLQCVPLFNLQVVDGRADMVDTINNIQKLVTSHDYVEVFWFPFNKQCWIKTWDKTPKPATESEIKWGWDELKTYLEISTFGKFLMDRLQNTPSLTPLIMQFFSFLMPENKPADNVIAESSFVFHYQTSYLQVWDMSYCINIPNNDFTNVQKAWNQVVNRVNALKDQGLYPQNMVLHTRYIQNSSAYLSPTVGNDHTCCIEILTFNGDGRPVAQYEDYFKQIEQDWIALGGKPHWGKAIYSIDNLKSMYGANMAKFLQIRQSLDPNQVFMNDFLYQVFQMQPSK